MREVVFENLESSGCRPRFVGNVIRSNCPVCWSKRLPLVIFEEGGIYCHGGCTPDMLRSALQIPIPSGRVVRKPRSATSEDLIALSLYAVNQSYLPPVALSYLLRRFGLCFAKSKEMGLGYDSGSSLTHRPWFVPFADRGRITVPFLDPSGKVKGMQGRCLGNGVPAWKSLVGSGWQRWGYHHGREPVIVTESPSDGLTAAAAGYAVMYCRGASVRPENGMVDAIRGRRCLVVGNQDLAGYEFSKRYFEWLSYPDFINLPVQFNDLSEWQELHARSFRNEFAGAIAARRSMQ